MDESLARTRFNARLSETLDPMLHKFGFTGSGKHFRRQIGEILHCVTVQGHSRGGRSTINLGIHPVFLPGLEDTPVDPETILEVDCEFRNMLHPSMRGDHWWDYQTLFSRPERQALDMVKTFRKAGEPFLKSFSDVDAILEDLPFRRLQANRVDNCRLGLAGYCTRGRGCLTIARIHTYRGNHDQARRFAALGLEHVGSQTPIAESLRDILNSNEVGS